MNRNEKSLAELFAAADAVGGKYQTEDERQSFKSEMDKVMADIRRKAAANGEYDAEKDMWLL